MSQGPVLQLSGSPSLLTLFDGQLSPGIWGTPRIPNNAADQAFQHGWYPIEVCLAASTSKGELLDLLAEAAAFPSYFGKNWDATAECLEDMSWRTAPGYLFLLRRAEEFQLGQPALSEILRDVLGETIEHWTSLGVSCYALWETACL